MAREVEEAARAERDRKILIRGVKMIRRIRIWLIKFFGRDDWKAGYYPCECRTCGWIGSSRLLHQGEGSYECPDEGDVYCPKCGSLDVDEV